MTFIKFLAILPDLLKLFINIEKRMGYAKSEKKIKEDIKEINKAFEENDEEALNNIFNS